MGRVASISTDEKAAAYEAAVNLAQAVIGEGTGLIHPNARVGQLSPFEWMKLSNAIVSGWICERSKQLTGDRWHDEELFLAMGETPEPAELGKCAIALKPLGELVEKLGLTNLPIGAWTKEQVLLFIWVATQVVTDGQVKLMERPGPVESQPELPVAFF